jgi:hypothetical protein
MQRKDGAAVNDLGRKNYEAYVAIMGAESGRTPPPYESLSRIERQAWEAGAAAVEEAVQDRSGL